MLFKFNIINRIWTLWGRLCYDLCNNYLISARSKTSCLVLGVSLGVNYKDCGPSAVCDGCGRTHLQRAREGERQARKEAGSQGGKCTDYRICQQQHGISELLSHPMQHCSQLLKSPVQSENTGIRLNGLPSWAAGLSPGQTWRGEWFYFSSSWALDGQKWINHNPRMVLFYVGTFLIIFMMAVNPIWGWLDFKK